ncbi:hypothetical protein KSS87_002675 [Heliosperma pusillum]|nr:hypothetical protein KSS87_002675 [Heliosperma pusillum]
MELMPKERMRSSENDVDRDRLNEMPDEVIERILSLMPTTLDAVRTVLFRRFGNLWTSIDTLIFDDRDFLNHMFPDGSWRTDAVKCRRFGVYVRNVLMLHKRLSIDRFLLAVQFNYHKDNIDIADDVKMWLRFALDRHAKQIVLSANSNRQFMEDHSILPNFTSQSLVALRLSGCRIDAQLRVNLRSLNLLFLDQIIMCDEAFQQFVSGSPSLQKLYVLRAYPMKKLSFSAPNIENLFLLLTSRDESDPLSLDCPNLENLVMRIYSYLPEVINVSSIRSIDVRNFVYATDTYEESSVLKMFLGKFEAAEVFKLSFDASAAFLVAIENLQLLQSRWKCVILEFSMFYEACLLGISQLLRSSRHLKELIICNTRGSDAACLVQIPVCVSPQLKTITLHCDVKPCNSLLKLVEFLLESAPVLDKLVIVPFKNGLNEDDGIEFVKRVSSFPMASTSATVVLRDRGRENREVAYEEAFVIFFVKVSAENINFQSDWPYAIHLLAHIYNADINSARFLWKSIPVAVKESQPEVVAVWSIGQKLWTKDYAAVYQAIRAFNWTAQIQPFVTAFSESYTKKMFQLLLAAYSTISVKDTSLFLGMNENEATKYVLNEGWSLDSASQMFAVKKQSIVTEQKLDASKLQRLTEYVFHLEH